MTKPHSDVGDNGGRCESCDRPETQHIGQTAYPLKMSDGSGGWVRATMWLCPDCLKKHQERDAAKNGDLDMRQNLRARLVDGTGREIAIRPGVIALSAKVPDVPVDECFLCTAPNPKSHKDGCDAYLGGFVHGVVALTAGGRPPLCSKHEMQLREMLVTIQDVEVYKKLGIETKTVG